MTDFVPCFAVPVVNAESAANCTAFAPDPSARLTSAFNSIAARMQGLDFVNPALRVEAVGFASWETHWLGVMVTPWFINLMLVPRDAASWVPLRQGETRRYRFPAGDYHFIGARDATIGDYQMCSLFSPALDFADHESARLVAQLAREALFNPENAEEPACEPASAGLGPQGAPMSKRDFLRGRFLRADSLKRPE
jgi:[NiFe] hydrogenase assembly HybE family chaperone